MFALGKPKKERRGRREKKGEATLVNLRRILKRLRSFALKAFIFVFSHFHEIFIVERRT